MTNLDYRDVQQVGKDLHLLGIRHFNLDETLDCGQAFRYEKFAQGYSGIAYGRRVTLQENHTRRTNSPSKSLANALARRCCSSFGTSDSAPPEKTIVIKNTTIHDFNTLWKNYFDLGRNYAELRNYLAEYGGEPMRLATEYSPGLRHMKQEPWEILISFILSQNTNIPRIKLMLSRLCENFGKKLICGGYTFPTSERLASLSPDELAVIKCGYRAPYILDAAKRVTNGELELEHIYNEETKKIREELLKIHGVGPKVADCVLLLGFGKIEVCPKDVWVKRALAKYYPNGFPGGLLPFAGIAQQFLFHFVRKQKAASKNPV